MVPAFTWTEDPVVPPTNVAPAEFEVNDQEKLGFWAFVVVV